jgi:hypothetical protein
MIKLLLGKWFWWTMLVEFKKFCFTSIFYSLIINIPEVTSNWIQLGKYF